MPAPNRIKQLVETFEQNINDYRFNKNETELRRQFLDPFFEALGWDVDNKQGKDERHKEVAHEFSVEIDGQQKKADYAFRIEKDAFDFLVEAKKPSVKVESNPDAAFQIRSYGWSAKIPVNILTDFEHLAIYDCRVRPNYAKDDAKTGRIELIHYKEYIERWDEIAKLFSPDAIRNGALDEYTDGLKSKKGTQEVDDAFLEEIEGWREALAKNIASRNKDKNLNEEQINFAVQMTIDRIIFLRICEERGIEKEKQLFGLAFDPHPASPKFDNKNFSKKGKDSMSNLGEVPKAEGAGTSSGLYEALIKLFQKADDRYNSGLFHFKKDKNRENPDTLSQSLEIDDKVLKDILKDLYYPSPYAFTYIPTEILGSVYERFLGKVIRLTTGGNAKVEEKPEVRKAGGVYYTPSYIVEYIVKNTVGKLLGSPRPLGEERGGEGDLTPSPSPERRGGLTPDDVAKIKIVDPACGSGSFLLGAYQFLLDWHLDYYASHQADKWVKNRVILTADNKTYRLSIDEKKRILLNNIHGVDLDPQAVEVTKLSLLLKVVEDPGQLKMFEEGHILPNLNKNIKNGNALIGTDYFSGQMFNDMEEMKRVRPFDWENEFPEIFNPHRPAGTSPKSASEKTLKSNSSADLGEAGRGFDAVIGNPPYGASFTSKEEEYFSSKFKTFSGTKDVYTCFIEKATKISNTNSKVSYIVPSGWIGGPQYTSLRVNLLSYEFEKIVLLPFDIFEDAYVDTLIFVLNNHLPDQNHLVETFTYPKREKIISMAIKEYKSVKQSDWNNSTDKKFILNPETIGLLGKFSNNSSRTVKDICQMRRGVLFDSSLLSDKQISEKYFRYFEGDVYRYKINLVLDNWVEFGDKMKERPKEFFWFEGQRILLRRLVNRQQRLMASLSDETFINNKNLYSLIPNGIDVKILLGVLNSRLLSYVYIQQVTQATKDDFPQVTIKDILSLPFPSEESIRKVEVKLLALVEKMLALHKSLAEAKDSGAKELLGRQITSTDKAIDSLVYELYGLSQEEIGIVEG